MEYVSSIVQFVAICSLVILCVRISIDCYILRKATSHMFEIIEKQSTEQNELWYMLNNCRRMIDILQKRVNESQNNTLTQPVVKKKTHRGGRKHRKHYNTSYYNNIVGE